MKDVPARHREVWGVSPDSLEAGWPMASPVFNQGRNNTANPEERSASAPGSSRKAEIGYGLGFTTVPGTITPFASMTLGDDGGRSWRAGARWQVADDASLSLQGTRVENSNATNTDQSVMLQGSLRW